MNRNGSSPSSILPSWTAWEVILGTLFIVAVMGASWLLVRFRAVIFVLFIAIVISTAITPAVDWLNRRGIPRALGVILFYLALLGLAVGFGLLVVPLVLDQTAAIATVLPEYYQEIQGWLVNSPSYLLRRLGYELPVRFQLPLPVEAGTADEGVFQQAAQAFSYAGLVARGLLLAVAVFLLGFYWTLDGERTLRSLLLLIPSGRREGVREIVTAIQARLGNYIRGQTILCLSIGCMALVAYLVIGVPYAFSLALFAALMEAVPVIGPALGAIPAAMVAMGAGEPEKILWVVVATVIIQALEGNLLVPRIMGKSVGVSPFVTLLAIAAFTSLLGVAGAVLAIPVAAVIQVLMDRFVLQSASADQAPLESRDMLSVLHMEIQELTNDVRKQVREKDGAAGEDNDQIEDAIESIASDLDQILVQASQPVEYDRGALP